MKRKIKYVGYYDSAVDGAFDRLISPAAVDKMNYVSSLLKRNGGLIEFISLARTKRFLGAHFSSCLKKPGVRYIYSLGGEGRVLRAIDFFVQKLFLFIYLVFTCSRADVVVAYHSLGYGRSIYWARRIKKFKVILEVEEIYSDVLVELNKKIDGEMEVIRSADAYIFPTDLLNRKVNEKGKPCLIIHGSYEMQEFFFPKFDDGDIHIVYAGTFQEKKGVLRIIDVAKFLPRGYHLHILGFGRDEEIRSVRDAVARVSSEAAARVTYEGLVVGAKYSEFLSQCHVGVASSEDISAAFNDTSFPSKILSYLAHDLRVVTVRIKATEGSAVASHITFVDSASSEEMAIAISALDFNESMSGRSVLKALDAKLLSDVPFFLSSIAND